MEDRQETDLFIVAVDYVDDAVVAVEELANCTIFDLRYLAAESWKMLELPNPLKNVFLQNLSEFCRADTLIILYDGVQFGPGLHGKPDTCHGVLFRLP